MSARVYLAAGAQGVRRLRDEGVVEAPCYLVTSQMRAESPGADEEDLEYDAARQAEDALRESGAVVVVVAADVPSTQIDDTGSGEGARSGDHLSVPRSAVVSLHVAERDAGPDEELLWYDVTEIDDVLTYLGE